MKPPFRLVREEAPHDVVADLRNLLERAERGEVIGVAYAAMTKQRGFVVNTSGEAHRNPTFARGMLAALDDELAQRIR
jgi:hypothetical protein